MFSIFSKKNDTNENDEILASITYVIKKNSSETMIDVQLDDFDEPSTEALCSILEILGHDMCYVDTVNIIKELFSKQDRYDLLIKIFSKIETNIKNKIVNSAKNRIKDEPFIKPSEMLR